MAKNEIKTEKEKKEKKPGKIKRFFSWIGRKFKELKSEWKKISWASKKATFKNFALVLVIVSVFAVAIAGVDILSGMAVSGLNFLGNMIY
ncbi:MAG: preprotein translocase subunit SecE [Clostridia bacterium]|nr:preprotein translocase subunit SecE [Clostridia bacterium]